MSDSIKKSIYKILIVGDGGVGKTTFLNYVKTNKFDSKTKPTLGIGITTKQIKTSNHIIMIQLWDFSGQEQFRHMLREHTLGANGAIFIYDITRPNTLNNISEWINICKTNRLDIPILLVGNKADLEGKKIAKHHLKNIMKKLNLFARVIISSKTGKNVPEVLELIAQELIQKDHFRNISKKLLLK